MSLRSPDWAPETPNTPRNMIFIPAPILSCLHLKFSPPPVVKPQILLTDLLVQSNCCFMCWAAVLYSGLSSKPSPVCWSLFSSPSRGINTTFHQTGSLSRMILLLVYRHHVYSIYAPIFYVLQTCDICSGMTGPSPIPRKITTCACADAIWILKVLSLYLSSTVAQHSFLHTNSSYPLLSNHLNDKPG